MLSRRQLILGTLGIMLIPRISSAKTIDDYCFEITPQVTIGVKQTVITTENFLRQNRNVIAAINGVYFGKDRLPEGLVYLAEDNHFATEKPEHTRGYFLVSKNGTKIEVKENLDKALENYWLAVGTHPLLVVNRQVHSQAKEKRYASVLAYRSAIGTKSGRDICFAVSQQQLSMQTWAEKLKSSGYTGAINLDGGPYSRLSVRQGDRINPIGKGNQPTSLVIFSYRR